MSGSFFQGGITTEATTNAEEIADQVSTALPSGTPQTSFFADEGVSPEELTELENYLVDTQAAAAGVFNAEANADASAVAAAASAAEALSSATSAATSEANAGASDTAASSSASAADTSRIAAEAAQSAAVTAKLAAEIAEGNAATSASNASTSESNAATSESNASASATAAAASATAAATSEANAESWASSVNIPSIVGQAGNLLQAKGDETGFEYRTKTEVLADMFPSVESSTATGVVFDNPTGDMYLTLDSQDGNKAGLKLGDQTTGNNASLEYDNAVDELMLYSKGTLSVTFKEFSTRFQKGLAINYQDMGDANFYLGKDSGHPSMKFDTGDIFRYDRANNIFQYLIASGEVARVEGAGTTASDAKTVMTREKGDARYAQLGADNTFTGTNSINLLRVTGAGDAGLTTTLHGFQVGPTSGGNIIIDGNEVMARSNGAAATLYLNQDGGTVAINGQTAWHAGNDGAGSGLDADLLDGQQGSYYLAASAYTASDVLTKIKTVDGSGSGLDADTVDGQHASALGKGFELIKTQTFSGASAYNITNLTGYPNLYLVFDNVYANTGGIGMRLSTNNGSTFLANMYIGSASTNYGYWSLGGTTPAAHGWAILSNFGRSKRKVMHGMLIRQGTSANAIDGLCTNASTCNCIRIYGISGVLSGGTVYVYGMKE